MKPSEQTFTHPVATIAIVLSCTIAILLTLFAVGSVVFPILTGT